MAEIAARADARTAAAGAVVLAAYRPVAPRPCVLRSPLRPRRHLQRRVRAVRDHVAQHPSFRARRGASVRRLLDVAEALDPPIAPDRGLSSGQWRDLFESIRT